MVEMTKDVRFLENVILNILLVATFLEHLCHTGDTTHSRANSSSDFRGMYMLVELIWIGDTRGVESLGGGNQCPESGSVGLSDDIVGNTVTASVPSSGNLSSDGATEREGLGDHDASTLLELGEPVTTFSGPDITLVAVLQLELLRLGFCNFDGLEVVDEFDLLVEDLLTRIVSTEKFGFYLK